MIFAACSFIFFAFTVAFAWCETGPYAHDRRLKVLDRNDVVCPAGQGVHSSLKYWSLYVPLGQL